MFRHGVSRAAGINPGAKTVIACPAGTCHFTGTINREVTAQVLRLKHEKGLGAVISLLNILKTLCQSDEHQTLSSSGFIAFVDEFTGERINKAYQYVFKHFTEVIDHQEIARSVGMNLSAFCHYFKRVTGRTLSDFIKKIRIGHARKLLMEADTTVVEIAYASGFESLSNFNRQVSGGQWLQSENLPPAASK